MYFISIINIPLGEKNTAQKWVKLKLLFHFYQRVVCDFHSQLEVSEPQILRSEKSEMLILAFLLALLPISHCCEDQINTLKVFYTCTIYCFSVNIIWFENYVGLTLSLRQLIFAPLRLPGHQSGISRLRAENGNSGSSLNSQQLVRVAWFTASWPPKFIAQTSRCLL